MIIIVKGGPYCIYVFHFEIFSLVFECIAKHFSSRYTIKGFTNYFTLILRPYFVKDPKYERRMIEDDEILGSSHAEF